MMHVLEFVIRMAKPNLRNTCLGYKYKYPNTRTTGRYAPLQGSPLILFASLFNSYSMRHIYLVAANGWLAASSQHQRPVL